MKFCSADIEMLISEGNTLYIRDLFQRPHPDSGIFTFPGPSRTPSSVSLSMTDDKLDQTVDSLISDLLLSWATINIAMMGLRKHQSLCPELHGVSPSSRRFVTFSKSVMRKACDRPVSNPFEEHLAGL
jgi:hypothetical protein